MSILTSKNAVTVALAASRSIEEIPEMPGVYAFYSAITSRRAIGLYSGGVPTADEIARARKIFSRKLQALLALRKARAYSGEVKDPSRGVHLSPAYDVTLQEKVSLDAIYPILELDDDTFIKAVDLLEETFFLQVPVYFGITKSQTLRDRCRQHRYDFRAYNQNSTFGFRAREAGLDWSDLIFSACPSKAYGSELVQVERIMHLLTNPILSLR
ncbi:MULTISPECIES: hypothetical protein [Marinobacter]|uniref:hypothetical protein n=1 Tax=Marinobacter TaxID=2742 RepID=UPI001B2DBAD8|nr:hypothetical protein [Marinobacter sp.]MBO6813107.1 hypothetical protein [Marinobacter sp.]MBO6873682.1 hypothetical protein [Marinobacter sp.]